MPDERPHPSVLDALRKVEALQERRVALWHEYDDAMNAFFAAPPAHTSSTSDAMGRRHTEESNHANVQAHPSSCAAVAGQGQAHQHSHQQGSCSSTLPPDTGTITEITRIVATGLLEVGHELRSIQIQLGLPLAPEQGSTSPSHGGPEAGQEQDWGLGRSDLARVLDQIQEGENALLRETVARDQRRRSDHLRIGQDPALGTPPPTWWAQSQAEIRSLRDQVQGAMMELAAEKAELTALGDDV